MNKRQKTELDERFKNSRLDMFNLLHDIQRAAHKTAKAVEVQKDLNRALELGFKRLVDLSNRSGDILEKIMRPFDD